MTTPLKKIYPNGVEPLETAKHWLMVFVSAGLIGLYVAALAGWLRPVTDLAFVARLEPIIFVLIGYYFGHIPGAQLRRDKRKELERTIEKLESTQLSKEQVQGERDALAEKIHNARIALERAIAGSPKEAIRNGDPHVPHTNGWAAEAAGTKLTEYPAEIVRKILGS